MRTKTIYVRVPVEMSAKIDDFAHTEKLAKPQAIGKIFDQFFASGDLKSWFKAELERQRIDINGFTLKALAAKHTLPDPSE